jgi:putative MATE family efflux protein
MVNRFAGRLVVEIDGDQDREVSRNRDAMPLGDDAKGLQRLGTGRINRLMLEFVAPSILSISLSAIYNIIDALFLGRAMGDAGLAATQAAFPLTMVIMTLVCLPGFGGVTVVSLHLGANKHEQAEQVLGNTTTLSIVFGILCMIAGLVFLKPLLALGGATPEIMPNASIFMSIILAGTIPQALFLNLNNFIRAAGSPKRALLYNGSGMLICIVLNFFFVTLAGWGVAGSASATIIGQSISAVLIVAYLVGKKSTLTLRLSALKLAAQASKPTLILGIPQSLSQFVFSAASFLLNYQFVLYGAHNELGAEGALASVGLIARIALFSTFVLFGISIGAQPLLGFNFGARKYHRLRRMFWVAVLWTTVSSLIFLAILLLFAPQIVSAFGLSSGLASSTVRLLTIYLLPLPLSGFVIIAMCYYQAVGKALLSSLLSMFKQGLLLVPLLLFMPVLLPALLPGIDAVTAVILAVPVAEVVTFFIALPLILSELRQQALRDSDQGSN